ncbi:glycogen-binding subunit 76A isoform X2 [Pieris rapae]|uniref:glycogen-binding subunit 76A isoform X2 n=1 Tax=Pieris rapae TaxID=64459 RepID=UPI001E27B0A9|nr:glycogen-binding subunit 76A isoform X2 [Pieris rapae]
MDLRTQMNGDHASSQCGLTSLLPMSCRGRAAAFARDLQSRLRNLGTPQDAECENSWLNRENGVHRPSTSSQRDLDTFYDFELECESPSSPVEEYSAPFTERFPEDSELPFYDIDSDELKEQKKFVLKHPDNGKNGFKFTTAFFTESPIKSQPVPKENGHLEKPLFSAITFEGCARQNSFDEVDCVVPTLCNLENGRILPHISSTIDSDSEFESAKSEPSDVIEDYTDLDKRSDDNSEALENISLDAELPEEDETKVEQESVNCESKVENGNHEANQILETDCLSATENEQKHSNEENKLEEEGEDDRPQRVRRCSSLKTGKTPPGTPGRKKIVRFADVLGLDLADVKTFMDEIPVIPKSAYDDLTGCDVQNSPPARPTPRLGALTLVPLFRLPNDLTDKLEKQNICLESARVSDGVHITICGSVRVRNLDFHKTVHIRYTMNRWKTYTDLQAIYVQGSCDGYSDRFQFVLYAPCISSGQRLEIAARFQCKGQQFWDNNCGANYCFDCLALGAMLTASSPPGVLHPTVDWHPSFY